MHSELEEFRLNDPDSMFLAGPDGELSFQENSSEEPHYLAEHTHRALADSFEGGPLPSFDVDSVGSIEELFLPIGPGQIDRRSFLDALTGIRFLKDDTWRSSSCCERCVMGWPCGEGGSGACGCSSDESEEEPPVSELSLRAGSDLGPGGDSASPGSESPPPGGGANANYNVEIVKIKRCKYRLVFNMWINAKGSKRFGCKKADIARGKKQIRDAFAKYWKDVKCKCKKRTRRGLKDEECSITVVPKFHQKGKPTMRSGSMTKEEMDKHRVKSAGGSDVVRKGSPAEVYFKCGPAPRKPGSTVGLGSPGNSNYNGFFWVYSGAKNKDRKDLLATTAHELGHNITPFKKNSKGELEGFHSKNPLDIMFATSTSKGQSVTSETACRVVEMFSSGGDELCKGCCEDGTLTPVFTPPKQGPKTGGPTTPTKPKGPKTGGKGMFVPPTQGPTTGGSSAPAKPRGPTTGGKGNPDDDLFTPFLSFETDPGQVFLGE